MTDQQPIDPALWRGLTQSRTSRRSFLRAAGVGAGALSLSSILAACGTSGVSTNSPAENGVGSETWWSQQTPTTELNYANWPYYIDTAHGKHPSIEQFQQQTGITVNYTEPINDNTSFFTKIRPDLQAGNYIGYDVIVLTNSDPPLSELIGFGWAVPLDRSKMTNFTKYASPLVTDPTWDPGNKYTMAWQSGYTCIGYNTKYITEPITSIQSLFDPKYSGKIGMMGISTELGSAGLLAIGVDPAASTPDDWSKAAEKLDAQKPLVRSYYDQDYIKALKNEDIWISMVWSGDVFQAANYQGYDTLKAVIPDEGSMFWTDNQLIPIGVQNPVAAMEFMDYVYDPKVQALIEDYNAYVCPVPASKAVIADPNGIDDPTVANSPTVFPDAQMVSRSKPYYQFQGAEDLDQWNNTFEPIYTG
jgi:spermidine/putrescine transport system substrate-binding protein